MRVEIDISDEELADIIRRYGRSLFVASERYDKPLGREMIQKACNESVKAMDFSGIVTPILLEIARKTAPEVVREILLKELKVVAKELRNDGTLFQAMKGEEPL